MSIHKPVLLEESLEKLNLKKGGVVVDATLGGGGHSREILKEIGENGILIAFDQDIKAIKEFTEFSNSNFQFSNNFQIPIFKSNNQILINSNFANLRKVLKVLKIKNIDSILADLGMSSDQLENKERGFSFQKDAELDMRMDKRRKKTAKEIVNTYSQNDLEKILREFGEEKYARRISRAIIAGRKTQPIRRTSELVKVIKDAVPFGYGRGKRHFATKTFQALRMETNDELENIKRFLPQAISVLRTGGRLAVISFHSGEDKAVKGIFRENARGCICPPKFPVCRCGRKPKIKIITKKPIIPKCEEIEINPRARSAKLRVAEKI